MHVQLGEEKEELMTDGFFQVPCSSQRTIYCIMCCWSEKSDRTKLFPVTGCFQLSFPYVFPKND